MSAYIVEKRHIDFLVQVTCDFTVYVHHGGTARQYTGAETAEERRKLGQMLIDECVKSVTFRYSNSRQEIQDNLPGAWEGGHTYEPAKGVWTDLNIAQVAQSCSCFSYQACEHPGWEASKAHAVIQGIEKACLSRIRGYEDAEWGAPKDEPNAISLLAVSRGEA